MNDTSRTPDLDTLTDAEKFAKANVLIDTLIAKLDRKSLGLPCDTLHAIHALIVANLVAK